MMEPLMLRCGECIHRKSQSLTFFRNPQNSLSIQLSLLSDAIFSPLRLMVNLLISHVSKFITGSTTWQQKRFKYFDMVMFQCCFQLQCNLIIAVLIYLVALYKLQN
eukprot:988747_1